MQLKKFGFLGQFIRKVDQIVTGRGRVDADLFEDLEELLIQSDVNINTTLRILANLREAVQDERMVNAGQVKDRLRGYLLEMLESAGDYTLKTAPSGPTVYLIVGVNGVGKTTTIAKLAHRFQKQGKKVVLAAGDTFRAAAIDQLEIWAGRTNTDIIKHKEGSDPSAVVFDAIKAARARNADYVIADTAGRLHNRSNLMEELKKIRRVTERELGREAEETLLVLDATTGQNGISQAKNFMNAVPLTGISLAKLDGTARGGIVITIADELKLPIKLVGLGEKPDDLELFSPKDYIESLFNAE
ncbi:MAG: Signal recognition particle receptor FtsY [Chthonomonadales bacterium]|nr:Signal recognition particle receptor FtsY [Chthonomonadales bacterium]